MNQKLAGWMFAVAIVLLVVASVVRDNFGTAGWLIALFYFTLISARPDMWWMIAVASLDSGITFGLPGVVDLHSLFVFGFIATAIVKFSVSKRPTIQPSMPRRACTAFLVVLILTASWRGWGLKILDSATWGGMQYVNLIGALLFYIYSTYVTVSLSHLERMLRFLFLTSLIPAAACLLVYFVPSARWIDSVIPLGETTELQGAAMEGARWASMQAPAIWMGVLALLLYDRRLRFSPAVGAVAAFSFVLLGLSGHRTVAVILGLTTGTYLIVKRRAVRVVQFMKLAVIVIALVAMAYVFVGNLPRAFQRALAWLPGIEVTYDARMDASSTSEWRIELWRQLLPMVPDYLWIGRGLAFRQSDAQSVAALASDQGLQYLFFTAVHLYHSGPLWLLIDLGLAGFGTALLFIAGGIIHYGRRISRIPDESRWRTAYVVFYSFFVGYCISFFAAFGSGSTLCQILILASVLEVIARSAETEGENRSLQAAEKAKA